MENIRFYRSLGVLLVAALLAPVAYGDDPSFVAHVNQPCTDQESWEFGPMVSQAWQSRFAMSSNLVLYASAEVLRDRSRNADLKVLGDYEMGRSLYRMRLPELAAERFNSVLAGGSEKVSGLRTAALECLSQIQSRVPSVGLAVGSIDGLKTDPIAGISNEDRARLNLLLVAFLERQISGALPSGSSNELSGALALLSGSGPYEAYISALQAAKSGNMAQAIAEGNRFLGYGDQLPQSLRTRANATRILVGQLEYDNGKYQDAEKDFRAVDSESNYLAQALTNLAWARFLQKNYAGAMGAARNLLMGGLKRTFSPEANLVTAISFLSTCHYAEALKSIKMLQKRYWYSYNWLYHWNRYRKPGETPYRQLASYLKKTGKIPTQVASEWARSPIFIQSQEELNEIYDERDALTTMIPKTTLYAKKHRGLARSLAYFTNRMQQDLKDNHARETALVDKINADLTARGKAMLVEIGDVWGNSQLVEVDTYNQLGDKMMADNFSAKYKKMTENKKVRHDDSPTWDWGRVPATDQDSEEVWEDEVGYLQMDLQNQCVKKN